jgi:hypothetical protein
MKTLIISLLVILSFACKKEEITLEGSDLIRHNKVWYKYDPLELIEMSFENDTLAKRHAFDYTGKSQMIEYFTYKFKEDSLITFHDLGKNKVYINRFKYTVNNDSLCLYIKGYLNYTYYSKKK